MGNYQLQPSRISERSADTAPIELSSRLIGAGQGISTLVENSLQINLFMQNKPNFQKSQMNVSIYLQMDYENLSNWTLGENKPNSNPIKPNSLKAQMNINSLITKDYRKKDDFAVQKNKPNSNPISKKDKMNVNTFSQKDYENKTAFRPRKNKPNQTQWIKRIRGIFRRFLLAYLIQAPHINITIPIISLKKRICPQNQKKS